MQAFTFGSYKKFQSTIALLSCLCLILLTLWGCVESETEIISKDQRQRLEGLLTGEYMQVFPKGDENTINLKYDEKTGFYKDSKSNFSVHLLYGNTYLYQFEKGKQHGYIYTLMRTEGAKTLYILNLSADGTPKPTRLKAIAESHNVKLNLPEKDDDDRYSMSGSRDDLYSFVVDAARYIESQKNYVWHKYVLVDLAR